MDIFNTFLVIFLVAFLFGNVLSSKKPNRPIIVSTGTKKMMPVVINTWGFTNATAKAWDTVYKNKRSALDSVEKGCTICELEQCDGTVGYGGSPDENGETTLDAMIMDGDSMNMGAVAALRRIKDAISVARHVLDYTTHSMLAGDQATEFAISMGFHEESLQTLQSRAMWQQWKLAKCQPNFWTNVAPDPKSHCGPYVKNKVTQVQNKHEPTSFGEKNHDTIGMVVIDSEGRMAAGTSTNGAKHKIPGRVGDSPIPGAGAYVDSQVGGAAATGDGDVMMRFLPSYLAVEEMRRGTAPSTAGQIALRRIIDKYPNFVGGIVVLRADGEFGAACYGLETFPYSVCNSELGKPTIQSVTCIK